MGWQRSLLFTGLGLGLGLLVGRTSLLPAQNGAAVSGPKPATVATKQRNAEFLKTHPFKDTLDFELAKKGFIAELPNGGVVKNAGGQVVWDASAYDFIRQGEDAPDTVNPSLWRQAQLLAIRGIFKVTDQIYQVRGYDLSNITFIEGREGVTVVDPLTVEETAKAGLDLYYKHRPQKPIVAVIYTHSHADHFGGVRGIVTEEEVKAGKVRIIAPQHFTEEAVSENIMAGNAMSRRATYMYGPLLPKNPQGQVTNGLGLTTPSGNRVRNREAGKGGSQHLIRVGRPVGLAPRDPHSQTLRRFRAGSLHRCERSSLFQQRRKMPRRGRRGRSSPASPPRWPESLALCKESQFAMPRCRIASTSTFPSRARSLASRSALLTVGICRMTGSSSPRSSCLVLSVTFVHTR